METIGATLKTKRLLFVVVLAIAVILSIALTALGSTPAHKPLTILKSQATVTNVANPPAAGDACQSLQVLVILDRSGSVTDEGTTVVQQYKDQVKKVWHTLHNISMTYGGFTSGYLDAFAGRTSDQTSVVIAKDNDKSGTVNENDRNLSNPNVLSSYDTMTQNVYFRSGTSSAMYPSGSTAALGYNPQNEGSQYTNSANGTNWHDSFLLTQGQVETVNAANNAARNYNMVIMITDGAPTLDDGVNNKWDLFTNKKSSIDENFDGSENTTQHVTLSRNVINSLRSGKDVTDSTKTFTPVQVYGILIGGGSAGATRMSSTFGSGNWFQSNNFDTTLGAQLLSIVGATCPPAPTLQGGLSAHFVGAPTSAIEDDVLTYTVDVTNTGTALLENVAVSNGTVSPMSDPAYENAGYLSPGKSRRFIVSYQVPGGATSRTISIPYSAHVAEDPSLLAPGSPLNLGGTLTSGLNVTLIPRPA